MDIKSKLDGAVKKAKSAAEGAVANGKAKFNEAGGTAGLKAKGVAALAEIKANFKADEGATGAKKYVGMFANLWKSGANGKAALIACSVVLLSVLLVVCSGDGKPAGGADAAAAANEAAAKVNEAAAKANEAAAKVASAAEAAEQEAEARKKMAEAALSAGKTPVARESRPAVAEAKADDEEEPAVKIDFDAIKTVEDAKKALRVAFGSGDPALVAKVNELLSKLQSEEAERAAKEEADRIQKEQELAEKEQAERNAKIEAERAAAKEAKRKAWEAIPSELAIKGLSVRMSGDAAVEACKKVAAEGEDLMALDFRKGLEMEKDEETKAAEKKAWEALIKRSEADIERFLVWNSLRAEVYQPAARDCAAPCPKTQKSLLEGGPLGGCDNLYVQWGDHDKATIPGPNYTVASALASLAGVCGYQVEWMLPGRRAGKKDARVKPTAVTIGVLKAQEFLKLHGVDGMTSRMKDREGGWQGREFNELLYPNVYDKGLMIHRDYGSTVYCRLVPQDESGNAVSMDDLATELAANFPNRYQKAGAKPLMVNMAQKDVEKLQKGIGNEKPYARMLETLAQNCKVSVEWSVLTEPAPKFEEITETFVIPGKTQKEACDFVQHMDSMRLGRYSSDHIGNDGSRKRYFFKKDLEDVGSPLWFRLVLKDKDGADVKKEDVVQNWLTARGNFKPSDKVQCPPKNLVQVTVNRKGVKDGKFRGLCSAWTDEEGNVKEIFFNEEGMGRLFDAADLSGAQFAEMLVKKYPGLPQLKLNVETQDPGKGKIEDRTWEYACPKGYRVKLFERVYIDQNGVEYNSKTIEKNPEANLSLSLAELAPEKYLSIVATKPEAARKFD